MKMYKTLLLFSFVSIAGIPAGYYDSASGLTGEELQWALHNIIDGHQVISYDYIWTAFYTTDDRYGDEVWDMYSDIPGGTPPYTYTLGDDQGGDATEEGDGYNREHSWPKSWFGDSPPMNTDLFHIIPTDIYVNNRRGNSPYGEVNSPVWTSLNGSRLGPSVTPGYSGTAFEPRDDFKGDIARNFFYMATRYKGEDGGWPGSEMADGADLEDWAIDMLMEWHLNDPVSTKELDRNEAVYDIQNNRNPFIDHPEFVQMIYSPSSGIEGIAEQSVSLLQCLPNPFSSAANLSYSLSSSEIVSLGIYDNAGRLVCCLQQNLPTPEGVHQALWTGRNSSGESVPPGIYFAVVFTENGCSTIKMILTGD
jgi:endonuclease I